VNHEVRESWRYAGREIVGCCRSVGPFILNLSIRWRNGHLHAPTALPPGREQMLPPEYEAGWDPDAVWMLCRTDKYIFFPARNGSTILA